MRAERSQQIPQESWRRSFAGVLDEIPVAARWLDAIASEQKLSDELIYSLQLCLEELLSNIARHGAGRGQGKHAQTKGVTPAPTIEIALHIGATAVTMTIEDDGMPFDVAAAPARRIDRPLEQVEAGGLGIQLIRSFSNDLKYERAGLGNRVTVEFLR